MSRDSPKVCRFFRLIQNFLAISFDLTPQLVLAIPRSLAVVFLLVAMANARLRTALASGVDNFLQGSLIDSSRKLQLRVEADFVTCTQ